MIIPKSHEAGVKVPCLDSVIVTAGGRTARRPVTTAGRTGPIIPARRSVAICRAAPERKQSPSEEYHRIGCEQDPHAYNGKNHQEFFDSYHTPPDCHGFLSFPRVRGSRGQDSACRLNPPRIDLCQLISPKMPQPLFLTRRHISPLRKNINKLFCKDISCAGLPPSAGILKRDQLGKSAGCLKKKAS